jgi:hypothetical protein
MNDKDLKKITNDLALLEAHLQQGLQICYRLKKKLGPAAPGPSSRKGLNKDQIERILTKRRANILKKASLNK